MHSTLYNKTIRAHPNSPCVFIHSSKLPYTRLLPLTIAANIYSISSFSKAVMTIKATISSSWCTNSPSMEQQPQHPINVILPPPRPGQHWPEQSSAAVWRLTAVRPIITSPIARRSLRQSQPFLVARRSLRQSQPLLVARRCTVTRADWTWSIY